MPVNGTGRSRRMAVDKLRIALYACIGLTVIALTADVVAVEIGTTSPAVVPIVYRDINTTVVGYRFVGVQPGDTVRAWGLTGSTPCGMSFMLNETLHQF